MSAGRAKWESRHRSAGPAERPPSAFVAEHVADLAPGRALDIASGSGRHALWLARRGWRVDAVDFAYSGLAALAAAARREGASVHAVQADLTTFPLPVNRYDLVVTVRYLQRTLFGALKATVRPGGIVAFETFLRDQQELGHPRNPAFLLERGELASHFRDFDLLAYAEGRFDTESGPAFLARLLARRPID